MTNANPRTTAADGKTEVFNIPGHPLMVRAADFNAALAAIAAQAQPAPVVANSDVLAALRRVVAADDAHTTVHATDCDDVARMVEWAEAFDEARAVLALHGISSPVVPAPKDAA